MIGSAGGAGGAGGVGNGVGVAGRGGAGGLDNGVPGVGRGPLPEVLATAAAAGDITGRATAPPNVGGGGVVGVGAGAGEGRTGAGFVGDRLENQTMRITTPSKIATPNKYGKIVPKDGIANPFEDGLPSGGIGTPFLSADGVPADGVGGVTPSDDGAVVGAEDAWP